MRGSAKPPIAVAYDLAGLRLLLAQRRRALGLTQLQVDEIAGLQGGYCGKLEIGLKGFGEMSLQAVLGALQAGLTLTLPAHRDMPGDVRTYAEMSKKIAAKHGRLGAIRTNTKLTPEQRRKNARRAATTRWLNWRGGQAAKRRKARRVDAPHNPT
jgi:hypothetical protein